ncbi:hypothetical protein GGQ68_004061 [Sagittula marina]|uniref:Uncharacterized protein n=1 Tax=Sagittula marina TaxID=943940 RepID=A0A7W6GUP0_9RHOB|nr:hypothetical protein [Sagittula marina]
MYNSTADVEASVNLPAKPALSMGKSLRTTFNCKRNPMTAQHASMMNYAPAGSISVPQNPIGQGLA